MKILLLDQIARVNYKYSFSLANALKDAGNDIELVLDDIEDTGYCRCRFTQKFLTARKDIGKLRKVINYLKAYQFIVKKAKNERFSIVHLQWFQLSPMDYFYLKKLHKAGIKLVVSIHDILPFNRKIYDMHFHKKIYGLCDELIVQATANIGRFKELFPEDAEKSEFIPHGHFLDFADVQDKAEARKKLSVPEDKTVLLFFGQIKRVKGLDILLEAYGRLRERRQGLFLIVAGSVWKDDFHIYREIIDKYSFSEDELKLDIRYIPEEETAGYFSASDAAVLPYTDIYQSGVLQMVYAYGLPAITSDRQFFKDFIEDGVNGYLSRTGDAESLAAAIVKAKENKEAFPTMGERGREKIRELYSWEDIANKVTKVYEKVTARA